MKSNTRLEIGLRIGPTSGDRSARKSDQPHWTLLAGRWEEDAIVVPAENELHLGMAVDTVECLLVPVIRNVGQSSLIEVAATSCQLADQTLAGKLAAADMQGGLVVRLTVEVSRVAANRKTGREEQ